MTARLDECPNCDNNVNWDHKNQTCAECGSGKASCDANCALLLLFCLATTLICTGAGIVKFGIGGAFLGLGFSVLVISVVLSIAVVGTKNK